MNQNKKTITVNKEDNYSSILNKILTQSNNHDKLSVYHMFELIKPEIVHSDLFFEYLRIWDKEFYLSLCKVKNQIKRRNKVRIISRNFNLIFNMIKTVTTCFVIIILYFLLSSVSIFLTIKAMEFLVKFSNGNLENFNFLNLIG